MRRMRHPAPAAPQPIGPSASSEYLRLLALGAARRGLDLVSLFPSCAIDRTVLDRRGARVEARAVKRLWSLLLSRLGDPLFGLRVAEDLPFGAVDLIDYLVRSSSTVGAALQLVTQYTALMTNTERMTLVVSGREASMRILSGPEVPHPVELVLGLFSRRSRDQFGDSWSIKRLTFAHQARGPRDSYERICEAPVLFGTPHSEAVFDRELLAQPMAGADPHLHAILIEQAEALLANVSPAPAPRTLFETIEQALAGGLCAGDFTLAGLADHLGMGVRTLQRRLRAEGVTHRQLVRRLRHDLAVQSLVTSVPQRQIARSLGYSGTGAFQRAFKSWAGLSPAEVRAKANPERSRRSAGHPIRTQPAAR